MKFRALAVERYSFLRVMNGVIPSLKRKIHLRQLAIRSSVVRISFQFLIENRFSPLEVAVFDQYSRRNIGRENMERNK